MSLSQSIRFVAPNKNNEDNPEGLYDFVKPSRWVFNNVNPLPNSGENLWFYVNTATGDLFEKLNGVWYLVYNFSTGGGGGGITAIQNDGAGLGLFNNIIGSTAHFKSVSGASGEIDIVDLTSEAHIAINPLYVPPLLSRFVDSRKIGSAPFAPPPSADLSAGFQVGDLWTVQGTTNGLYVCKDATNGAAIWAYISPYIGSNVGAVAGSDVFKGILPASGQPATFEFRKISGVAGQIINYVSGNDLIIGINNTYKPSTLSKVDNIKNNYTITTPPTSSDDSILGYQVGSVWSTGTELYICASATPAAAVWKEIGGSSPSPSTPKDYIQWTINGGGHVQNINNNFVDFDAGPLAPLVRASLTGTNFSSSFDGVRRIFTRGITTSDKAYRVSVSVIFLDFAGATTDYSIYEIRLIRKNDTSTYAQSYIGNVLYSSGSNNRSGFMSHSFVIKESSAGAVSYYLQILGRNHTGATAPNITIDNWSLSFDEI